MVSKRTKVKDTLFLVAILSTSIAVMYSTIFQVINYDIYKAFPGQEMAVNFFILSLPIGHVGFLYIALYL